MACALVAGGSVLALALADGGYSDLALGVATALVWVVLVGGVLSGHVPHGEASGAVLAAAGCLLALLAMTVLSFGWTPSDESAFAEAVRIAGYLGAFLLAGLTLRGSQFGPILMGVAAAGVAVAAIALGSRLLGIGGGDVGLVDTLPTAAGRLSYPVGYWNALGALVALALPALCWIAGEARSGWVRSLALAGFGPPILAAYLTSSRGALIAIALGLSIAVAFATERRRAAATAICGVICALPAVACATLASGIVDSAGVSTPGKPELVVIVALLLGIALAGSVGTRVADSLALAPFFALRVRVRAVLLAVAAVAAVLIVLAGPSALIGDLRAGTDGSQSDRTVGIVSASGSGRTQFWDAAVEAFATEPVRGIGAGGYESYWSQNGSLRTPARNAHSEPLELLAELGVVGAACFLGFLSVVLACGISRARQGGAGAPALGILAAGLVGFTIDWTWQMPAVVLPFLVVAGAITATSDGLFRVPRTRLPRIRPAGVAVSLVVLAVPAIWASGVLAVYSSRLDASTEALSRGHLDEAAAAARSAAAVEPWAAEPWLQLARIEQAGDNIPAAAAAVRAAVDRAPQEVRAWVLASNFELQLDNVDASIAYGVRAVALAPQN
ncbi:MAG: O-antigen ligase family protein [Solirubrobacterales bacterium]|nr:O-antigen ligase family protein [Solirubrobacterales bacterium]